MKINRYSVSFEILRDEWLSKDDKDVLKEAILNLQDSNESFEKFKIKFIRKEEL